MKNYLILLFISISLFSCNVENKKPEFKRIENVFLKDFTYSNIVITADVIVFNPNSISVFLQKTEIDVYANEIKVSHISQTENTEITKNSEFKIPLKASFKMQDLLKDEASIIDIISNSLKTYTDKKIDLNFVGTATFKVAGISFDIPIDVNEVVEIE